MNLPPQTFAILTSGASRTPTNPANPCFGTGSGIQAPVFDGLRCVAQQVVRHGTRPTDATGKVVNGWGGAQAGPPGGIATQGGFFSGQTRHFQVVFRDFTDASCGTGQNTTQSVTVTFLL